MKCLICHKNRIHFKSGLCELCYEMESKVDSKLQEIDIHLIRSMRASGRVYEANKLLRAYRDNLKDNRAQLRQEIKTQENKKRILIRVRMGICKCCPSPLDTKGNVCTSCKNKMRDKKIRDRQFCLDNLLCTDCKEQIGRRGRCTKCIENKKRRDYDYRDKIKKTDKCFRCRKNKTKTREGKLFCLECSQKEIIKANKIKMERRQRGFCWRCGVHKTGGKWCNDCKEKYYTRHKEKYRVKFS